MYDLTTDDDRATLRQGDFLADASAGLGLFDGVIMNPPFKQWRDIKHIKHALAFVRPGGRLVALCANGPRQREHLRPLADHWEELPAGTFKNEGTGVNVALLVCNVTYPPPPPPWPQPVN